MNISRPQWKCGKIFVYDVSRDQESEVGFQLVSPYGDELTYALRFTSKATNNKYKYVALLFRLHLA